MGEIEEGGFHMRKNTANSADNLLMPAAPCATSPKAKIYLRQKASVQKGGL
jgi:hypothetical protein